MSTTNRLQLPWMDMGNEPEGENFLVFLSEPHFGSRIQVARKNKLSNGHMLIIGGYFSFDVKGKPLKWSPMPEEPEEI